LKFGSLNFQELSGPVQACNGIALPFITETDKNIGNIVGPRAHIGNIIGPRAHIGNIVGPRAHISNIVGPRALSGPLGPSNLYRLPPLPLQPIQNAYYRGGRLKQDNTEDDIARFSTYTIYGTARLNQLSIKHSL
jgi:hypothetical protein